MRRLTHLKRPWCWARLKVGGEGDDRGWDVWMASTQWTWVWVNSRSWWWTGKPGMLQSMGFQKAGHDWVNWTEQKKSYHYKGNYGKPLPCKTYFLWGLFFQVRNDLKHFKWKHFQAHCVSLGPNEWSGSNIKVVSRCPNCCWMQSPALPTYNLGICWY